VSSARAGDFLASHRIACPVVQAGMGGGVAGGRLAGAVSAAGGLGTVGMVAPRPFAAALAEARRMAGGRPVAANLLVPFLRGGHVRACIDARATPVVLHGGISPRAIRRLRAAGLAVMVTVGTAREAKRALASGATGLVAQGSEAGGHLLGVEPIERTLAAVLSVADGAPVLAAGGVADAGDVARLLSLGAVAAVAGTRFLLSEESAAHEEYKRRVRESRQTIATKLFGLGWPLLHRVTPNAATSRWCDEEGSMPLLALTLVRLSGPLGRLTPADAVASMAAMQRPALPLFSPALPLEGMPERTVDSCALYAGETVKRLHDVVPAAEAVRQLAPG
jgi:NAD(P)H-dependent flavin oxidoreductase YrpB (nitropropane dioxygenase family)